MITIPKSEYEHLLRCSWWLECLESAGVDNWIGMEEAIVICNELPVEDMLKSIMK